MLGRTGSPRTLAPRTKAGWLSPSPRQPAPLVATLVLAVGSTGTSEFWGWSPRADRVDGASSPFSMRTCSSGSASRLPDRPAAPPPRRSHLRRLLQPDPRNTLPDTVNKC